MNGPQDRWIQPLVIRGSQGDCVKISFWNQLEGGEGVRMHIDGASLVVPATCSMFKPNPWPITFRSGSMPFLRSRWSVRRSINGAKDSR